MPEAGPRALGAIISHDPDVRGSYARDTSGLHLLPEGVARPASEAEVLEVLRHSWADRIPVTPAGGQTSTTGASITDRGLILSLRSLDRILDIDTVRRTARVQPGVPVAELAAAAAEHGLLFAPDPTSEREATLGGAVACNASGARTLRYGPTRDHVRALRVAHAGGDIAEYRRSFLEKNTVGYAAVQNPIDWFIGSEGTLGVVLEVEVALLPRPERIVGLTFPFPDEQQALAFVAEARDSAAVRPRCLEFFDPETAAIFLGREDSGPALVYTEETVEGDAEPDFDAWLALAERFGVLDADIQVYDDDAALRDARRRRHTVPATMQERGFRHLPAGGRRISTDWSVPYRRLGEMVAIGRRLARDAGIPQPVFFGHAGNGHPHANFIAPDPAAVERAEGVVAAMLREVVSMGGTVAAEHGIGKIKRRWVGLQLSERQRAVMAALKRELDPHGLMAPGNIL